MLFQYFKIRICILENEDPQLVPQTPGLGSPQVPDTVVSPQVVPPQVPATTTEPPQVPAPSTEPSLDPELDLEILSALGQTTSEGPEFGEKIHDSVAKLWLPLLKKGMPKEEKEKLLKEYTVPCNCQLLQAPKLNPEIAAAIPDMVRNRDKNMVFHQQQLGQGITAINRGIDVLLKEDKVTAIKHLSNACRILADLHATNTQNRIKLVTPSLEKTFLSLINDTERDETLFGNKLSEKIKAAKAVEKQGLQIKKLVKTSKTPMTNQSSGTRHTYTGNWTTPPPPRYPSNRGGRGGVRKPNPVTRRPYSVPHNKNSQPDKTRASHQ